MIMYSLSKNTKPDTQSSMVRDQRGTGAFYALRGIKCLEIIGGGT
jgi:hypothetical protein